MLWKSSNEISITDLASQLDSLLRPSDTFTISTLTTYGDSLTGERAPTIKILEGQLQNPSVVRTTFHWRVPPQLYKRMGLEHTIDPISKTLLAIPALGRALRMKAPLKLIRQDAGPILLQFGRGFDTSTKSVMTMGLFRKPRQQVSLALCTRASELEGDIEWIKKLFIEPKIFLNTHFRSAVDSFKHIWEHPSKLGLPRFNIADKFVRLNNDFTLASPIYLKDFCDDQSRKSSKPITITFLRDELDDYAFSDLNEELGFCGCKVVPTSKFWHSTLSTTPNGLYRSLFNLALQVCLKAGAVPWQPATPHFIPDTTVFIGADVGHDPVDENSVFGFCLVAAHGQVLSKKRFSWGQKSEIIPTTLFESLRIWIAEKLPQNVRSIVVHRDGKFLGDERQNWEEVARAINAELTLVEVKKSTQFRFMTDNIAEGNWCQISDSTAIMATCMKSATVESHGEPRPLEVNIVSFGPYSLTELMRQVYFLCLMNYSIESNRLPVTIRAADREATTKRVERSREKSAP